MRLTSDRVIVQKFGGTSIGSAERLLLVSEIVRDASSSARVVAVVSALSPETKAKGTTTLLLGAIDDASSARDFKPKLSLLRDYHIQTADRALTSCSLKEEACSFIERELEIVASSLDQIASPSDADNFYKLQDAVISAGEKLSAKLLSLALLDLGVDATYEDLSNILDLRENVSDKVIFDTIQDVLAARYYLSSSIPILTGFFGQINGGLLSRVGRGYTDFTAALVTAGLSRMSDTSCCELQVWKEVDGICSADPRRVPNAAVLDYISVCEAAELAYFGSEVLHPFTMARVAGLDVPIHVRNTFKPASPGTVVLNDPPLSKCAIRAITAKSGITVITVTSNRMYDAYGFLGQIFAILRNHAIVVDLVATSEISVSFTVNKVEGDKVDSLDKARKELEALGIVNVTTDQAILAIVGENMQSDLSVPSSFFAALASADINVHMISKGASKINISCVIDESCVNLALTSVHKMFFK